MARMSDINKTKSKYFRCTDLEEMTGKPWGQARMRVSIVRAFVDQYPAEPGEEPEDAYFLEFAGIAKPLGCNLTIRKVLEGIVGDVEWGTAALGGLQLIMYAEQTQMGPGVRLIFDAPVVEPVQPLAQPAAAPAPAAAPIAQPPIQAPLAAVPQGGESRFDDVPAPVEDEIPL